MFSFLDTARLLVTVSIISSAMRTGAVHHTQALLAQRSVFRDSAATSNSTTNGPSAVKCPRSFVLDEADWNPAGLLKKLEAIGVEKAVLDKMENAHRGIVAKLLGEERDPNDPKAKQKLEHNVWRAMAELGLLVGSARFHKKSLRHDDLLEALEDVRELDSDQTTLLKQCAEQGNFNLEKFTPVRHQSIAEAIDAKGKEYFGVKVAELQCPTHVPNTAGSLGRLMLTEATPHIDGSIVKAIGKKLVILTGPSGSGKTASMIALCAGKKCLFYCPYDLEKELEGMQKTQDRDKRVVEVLIQAVKDTLGLPTEYFDGTIVFALDELGGRKHFLKALCSFYKKKSEDGTPATDPLETLRETLKCKELVLIAGGTGCDAADALLGSSPETYEVFPMTDTRGEAYLKHIMANPPQFVHRFGRHIPFLIDPALRALLESEAPSWVGQYVRQSLLNRRVAALFFLEAGVNARWYGCDWYEAAPSILQRALVEFKGNNGLEKYTFDGIVAPFAKALAATMGGHKQVLGDDDIQELGVRTGLIEDQAKPRSDGKDDVDRSGLTHRYRLSEALVRIILNFLGGVAPRPRDGDGFEQTIADFMFAQLLAGTTNISIAPLENDPLEKLKKALRSLAKGAALVTTVQLARAATTSEEALEIAGEQLVQRLKHEKGPLPTGKFVAVLRNFEKAPAADLFAVEGTISAVDESVTVDTTESSVISVQCKHYTASPLLEYECMAEFFKMGSRTSRDCAGNVAMSAMPEHLASNEAFADFQREIMGDEVAALFALPRGCVSRRGVEHQALFDELVKQNVAPSAHSPGEYFLVALSKEDKKLKDDRVQWLVDNLPQASTLPLQSSAKPPTPAERALAPIRLRPMNSNLGFIEDVKFVRTPHAVGGTSEASKQEQRTPAGVDL